MLVHQRRHARSVLYLKRVIIVRDTLLRFPMLRFRHTVLSYQLMVCLLRTPLLHWRCCLAAPAVNPRDALHYALEKGELRANREPQSRPPALYVIGLVLCKRQGGTQEDKGAEL